MTVSVEYEDHWSIEDGETTEDAEEPEVLLAAGEKAAHPAAQ